MAYHIPTERIDALALAATEGRVIREDWHDTDADGREMACTLGWLDDDIEDPSECPSDYMPQWLAHLVPQCNDNISKDGFASWLSRVPGIFRRISAVPDDVWPVLERRAKARAIVEAMRHTDDAATLSACHEVLLLLHDGCTDDKFVAAGAATRTGAWYAARPVAVSAAWALDWAATRAADVATEYAAWDRMTAALLDDLDHATQGRDLGPFPTEPSR